MNLSIPKKMFHTGAEAALAVLKNIKQSMFTVIVEEQYCHF